MYSAITLHSDKYTPPAAAEAPNTASDGTLEDKCIGTVLNTSNIYIYTYIKFKQGKRF